MPVAVVRTAQDEEAWERAKELARRQYPGITGPRFYRIVMGIYKRMTHYQPRTARSGAGEREQHFLWTAPKNA